MNDWSDERKIEHLEQQNKQLKESLEESEYKLETMSKLVDDIIENGIFTHHMQKPSPPNRSRGRGR